MKNQDYKLVNKIPNKLCLNLKIYNRPLIFVNHNGEECSVNVEYYHCDSCDGAVIANKVRDVAAEYLINSVLPTKHHVTIFNDFEAWSCFVAHHKKLIPVNIEGDDLIIVSPDRRLFKDVKVYWYAIFELILMADDQDDNFARMHIKIINALIKAGLIDIDEECEYYKDHCKPKYPVPFYDRPLISVKQPLEIKFWPTVVYRYYRRFKSLIKQNLQGSISDKFVKKNVPDEGVVSFRIAKIIQECLDAATKYTHLVYIDSFGNIERDVYADIRPMKYNTAPMINDAIKGIFGDMQHLPDFVINPCRYFDMNLNNSNGVCTSDNKNILQMEYRSSDSIRENSLQVLLYIYHELAHHVHWRAIHRYDDMESRDAQCSNTKGATYEHQATKFAIWCCYLNGYTLAEILDRFHLDEKCGRQGYRSMTDISYRYVRYLSYLQNKSGSLQVPNDLKYIFTRKVLDRFTAKPVVKQD